jgi:hypothetical protein
VGVIAPPASKERVCRGAKTGRDTLLGSGMKDSESVAVEKLLNDERMDAGRVSGSMG